MSLICGDDGQEIALCVPIIVFTTYRPWPVGSHQALPDRQQSLSNMNVAIPPGLYADGKPEWRCDMRKLCASVNDKNAVSDLGDHVVLGKVNVWLGYANKICITHFALVADHLDRG